MRNILKNKANIVVIVVFLVLLVGIVVFKNLSFKDFDMVTVYDYYNNRNRTLEIDVPRFSLAYEKKAGSVYLWNIRENKILTKELELLFKDKELIACNGNEYYYDSKNDITIVEYELKDYYLWNTVYYKYEFENYCDRLEVEKADQIIDYGATYSTEIEIEGISYAVSLSLKSDFQASLVVKKYNFDRSSVVEYENSRGSFTLDDGKLIYTRDKKSGIISDIPESSEFMIQDKHTLVFNEDYLKELASSDLVLESDTK